MTEVRIGGWPSVLWGKHHYGVNFDAATSLLKGSHSILGSTGLAPERFAGKRWLHWEAGGGALCLSDVWVGAKDIVDSAVCIKVGDDRSGDIKAVRVTDDSPSDPSGPLKAMVSVLFEDGSIVLLKIRCKDGRESIVRDLVQFKEGELIDLRSDSYASSHVPMRQCWFQIGNMPPTGILSTGEWVSPVELAVTFGDGVNYCLYARLHLRHRGGEMGSDEEDEYSIDEWVLRDQTPFQEIISGWMGSRERPRIMAAAGISKSCNLFEDRALVASVSADGSLALWDVEARRPVLHAPTALYDKSAGGSTQSLEPIYTSIEEARVSVISNENYYDVLVAASTCKNRLLEWKIVLVRVYRSSNRELTYGVLRLATPAQLFSTYATLVDVCASGVSVSSVWRDGLKEREFLLTHGLPALAETKQHSNWVVDPAIKEASAAPMRCVAEAVTCSDVRVSTDYAMTPLDGQGLDGRLSAPCKLPISSGGKDRLVKNFGGSSVSTEGMTGLLKSLNCSSSKAIETLHAMMLKRIFCPGTFSGEVIKSVLLSGVPVELQARDSATLRRAAEDVGPTPQKLGAYVADVCVRWSHILEASADGDSMKLDSTYVVSDNDEVGFDAVSRLEEAYTKFFRLCAKKSFEYLFCRRGSLEALAGSEGEGDVLISRRGGVVGLMCAVPNRGTQCTVVASEVLGSVDDVRRCAGSIIESYRRQSHQCGGSEEMRCGLDALTSRISVFLEQTHDYSPPHTAWVSEALQQLSAFISSGDLRTVVPIVAAALAQNALEVLESLVTVETDAVSEHLAPNCGPSHNVVSDGLVMDVFSLVLKSSYEYMTTVCLALASILTSPVFPMSLPAGVHDAIALIYLPKAVNELMRISFLLWSRTVQVDETDCSRMSSVDVVDLQPRITVSSMHYMNCRAVVPRNSSTLCEGRVYGLMGGLMSHVSSGALNIYSRQFWEQFSRFCLKSLFQLCNPYSPLMSALIDSKNYSLVTRASSLCRAHAAVQFVEQQFNASSAIIPGRNFQVGACIRGTPAKLESLLWHGTKQFRTLADKISDVQTAIFHIQSKILKETQLMLKLTGRDETDSRISASIDRTMLLAEELFQSTDIDLSSFSNGRSGVCTDGNSYIDDKVLNMSLEELIAQRDSVTSDGLGDLSKWMEESLFAAGLYAEPNIVNFVECFYCMLRSPSLQLWLRNVCITSDEPPTLNTRLDILIERFPVVIAACFAMHAKALNTSFINRIRWLLPDVELRSVLALKGNVSCIEGIETISIALSADDTSVADDDEMVTTKCKKLGDAMMRLLRADMVDALTGLFSNAMEGNYFDEALTTILRLRDMSLSDPVLPDRIDGAMDLATDDPVQRIVVSKSRNLMWQSCLRSLVCKVCENGYLSWLCRIPNVFVGNIDLSELIMIELETLACSTELNGFMTAKKMDTTLTLPYCGNYYECLAAFQLSRFDYHGAARALNSLTSELNSLSTKPFATQACFSYAAAEALSMLPRAEQFIIQRPSVQAIDATSVESAAGRQGTVDAQSMISLIAATTLRARASKAVGLQRVLSFPVVDNMSTDALISELCDRHLFHEALCVASHSAASTISGVGTDGLEPLTSSVSSVSVTSDCGIGLFVYRLTTYCCDSPASADESCRSLMTGSSAYTGLFGHVVSPLAVWKADSGGTQKYCPNDVSHMWVYLTAVLRAFDGPHMQNWGLHRLAVLACLTSRPGVAVPEILVRSFCGDLLVPVTGEKGRGNGIGLLRMLYEHGHLLEACDLSTRIIKDTSDPRNKAVRESGTKFNASLEPVIPFSFLDKLILAVDRVLDAAQKLSTTGQGDSARAIAVAVLAKSQHLLKDSIEIMMKVNLIKSYDKN